MMHTIMILALSCNNDNATQMIVLENSVSIINKIIKKNSDLTLRKLLHKNPYDCMSYLLARILTPAVLQCC